MPEIFQAAVTSIFTNMPAFPRAGLSGEAKVAFVAELMSPQMVKDKCGETSFKQCLKAFLGGKKRGTAGSAQGSGKFRIN